MAPDVGSSAILSMIGSLTAILAALAGFAYLAKWFQRRSPRQPRVAQHAISVIATRHIGWQASLQIVEADGQRFLIGTSRSGITSIGPLDRSRNSFEDLAHALGKAPQHFEMDP